MKIQGSVIWSRLLKSGLFSLLLMILVVFSFRSAIADWNDVPTGSMRPTIMIGDRIFVNKLAYDLKIPFTEIAVARWDDPARGDIITCWSPKNGDRLVKRVVAIPGDTVAMKGGRLFLNGKVMDYEPTQAVASESVVGRVFHVENLEGVRHMVAHDPAKKALRDFAPIVVEKGKYFLMGDNRDNSADSRYFGFLDRSAVCGKVSSVVFSLDHDNHYLPRKDRFFTALN
ncbi:MAG: signal peptidase I [bacterium]|nr:signal peptidase I [bacterium]